MDSLQKNKKFMDTVKIFAIYGTIVAVINAAVPMFVSTFAYAGPYSYFNIGGLVAAVVSGLIGSAIGGALFYFFYEPVHNWIKGNAFLSKHIYSMFTLFWKPFLLGIIISALPALFSVLGVGSMMGAYGVASFGGMFTGWVIILAVHVVVYYFYAKTISAKLSPQYPW